MSYCPPPEALITPCVPGCDSRVMWEYEPGEPQTYWYPGSPDYFTPVKGCSGIVLDVEIEFDQLYPTHLEVLDYQHYTQVVGELYRQLGQWELLADAAWRNEHDSRRYLGAVKRLRSIVGPVSDDEQIEWENL